jgi:dTDP-4-amino-4,6-dideoxygalactose transaminase
MSGSRIPVNDLTRSWIASDASVREAIDRVAATGWYIKGPEHDAFELEFAHYVGIGHAIGLASGTDALILALQAVGCEAGSEIVTVANAGAYSSIAAAIVGCRVVYADVDARSLLVTPATLEAAIGPDTRAVIVTHLYGNVAEIEAMAEFCHSRGIAVIEDCAQAVGGAREGRKVGTFGNVAAFSFYPTKNLGAAGDGGAIATNDAAMADVIRSLRQYGWSSKYTVAKPDGRNSRLDEIQAAVLRIGLPLLDGINEARRDILEQYAVAIAGPSVRLVTGAGCPTVGHLAVIRVANRARAQTAFRDAAIATDIHYPIPDHWQVGLPAPARATPLPETERAVQEILTIPCFPAMTQDEVDRVCAVLGEVSAA